MKLHPLMAVLVLVTAGLAFAKGLQTAPNPEMAYPYAIGSAIGAMVGVAIFGVIAYFLSRRSSFATNTTVGIVCGLMLAGSALQLAVHTKSRKNAQNNAVIDQLVSQSEAIQAEQRAEFERTGSVSLDSERANQVLDQMSTTAAQVNDDNGRMMQASLKLIKELGAIGTEYEAKISQAQKLGGVDGEGVSSVADIDARVRVWREAAALAARMTARTQALDADVTAAVAATGAAPQAQRAYMNGFRDSTRLGLMIEVRRQEEQVIAGVLQQFSVLRNSFGEWRHDPADGLVFEVDSDREAYNAAADRIQLAAQKQTEAQAELVKSPPNRRK